MTIIEPSEADDRLRKLLGRILNLPDQAFSDIVSDLTPLMFYPEQVLDPTRIRIAGSCAP
jgi:hypothetical protein